MAKIVYTGEGCTGCKACVVACMYAHDKEFGVGASRIWVVKEEPITDHPIVCMQCEKPPCRDACPVGAISKTDGLVLVDEELCIGCGACIEACPFGAIAIHPNKHVAIKCDLCGGKEPQCVKFCSPKVLKLQAPALAPKAKVK